MTEANFISLHFPTGQENFPGTLHLNVNPGPVVGGVTQGIITSMIITVNAFSINGQTNNTYIESVLEQIETVKFTFNNSSYELVITGITYYPASNPFFYYTVEPAYVPNYNDAAQYVQATRPITFTPYLLDVQFGFSEFNPLISNASVGRKSDRIMVSDRLERTITPSNIQALLSESAEKAEVQDSLYSDTGWSNARYVGSETNAQQSAGIAPTVVGRTFTGQIFPTGSDTDYICALDGRLEQELFHTADTVLPTFKLGDFSVTLGAVFGTLQTQLSYSSLSLFASGSLAIGDVLRGDLPTGVGQYEYMKIQGIDTSLNKITVRRDIYNGWPGTEYWFANYPSNSVFRKVERFDIFRFENTGQNRIQLVNNSRVYVNGNNTIVDTDDYGQIVSSSQCPYIGYIVTD
jgi:hypothetical protein